MYSSAQLSQIGEQIAKSPFALTEWRFWLLILDVRVRLKFTPDRKFHIKIFSFSVSTFSFMNELSWREKSGFWARDDSIMSLMWKSVPIVSGLV